MRRSDGSSATAFLQELALTVALREESSPSAAPDRTLSSWQGLIVSAFLRLSAADGTLTLLIDEKRRTLYVTADCAVYAIPPRSPR